MPQRRIDKGHSTDLEVSYRVDQVLSWLISGFTRREIIGFCIDKFPVGEAMADNYIGRANVILKESAAVDRERELGAAIARFVKLYNRCEVGDPRAAASINKELAALLGLSKIRIDFSGDIKNEHSIKPEQAASIFDILAEHGIIPAGVDATETD